MDTKKADGEMNHLRSFAARFQARFTDYKVEPRICCFMATSRDQIVDGWKRRPTKQEAMTGAEFCKLIGISYENIRQQQMRAAKDNIRYFAQTLLQIDDFKEILEDELTRPEG